jgi:hypothetical protein
MRVYTENRKAAIVQAKAMKMKEQATSLISEVKPNITSDHDGNKIQIKALFIDGLPETNPKPKIKV